MPYTAAASELREKCNTDTAEITVRATQRDAIFTTTIAHLNGHQEGQRPPAAPRQTRHRVRWEKKEAEGIGPKKGGGGGAEKNETTKKETKM